MNNSTAILFSDKAREYAKYRPGYGQKPIKTLLSPFKGYQVVKTVDVGAGTGIGSRLLAFTYTLLSYSRMLDDRSKGCLR